MLSEELIKFVACYFIGDNKNGYSYKSGPQIYSFFRQYFGINLFYGDEKPIPSRWAIAYNRLVDVINSNRVNDFFTIIFSDSYISKELNSLDLATIEAEKQKHLDSINLQFSYEGYKIVKNTDKYRLVTISEDEVYLGDGGFATCYYLKSSGIVVKRLKEDYRLRKDIKSRFKREYDITKELNTKGIKGVITVFDFNESDLSYTMERAEMDLAEYIKNNKLTEEQKIIIIYQVLDVMNKVHKENIIHRDLSPGNILLFSGLFKLSDFGFGKNFDVVYSHLTNSTSGYGTWAFADPKVVMNLKEGNKLTDIYSIGRLINFIMKGNPEDNDHMFKSVSSKCTNDNDAFRYQSVDELTKSFQKIINYHHNAERVDLLEKDIAKGIVSEEVYEYVNSLSSDTIFDRIQNKMFCSFYTKLLDSKFESETHLQNKLSDLYDCIQAFPYKVFKTLDCLCDLAIPIILGNHDYVTKEVAIKLINIPLEANRYYVQNRVDAELVGNIEPSLEEMLFVQ